jgi:hypothetical protein
VPKEYTGAYGGNNSFYLPFNDGTSLTTLTEDRSGNGNNWTATNISLTAGATYDWMDDTPTNNFCTLNPLLITATNGTASSANLSASTVTVGGGDLFGTFVFPTAGKWYFETTFLTNLASCNAFVGVATPVIGTQYGYQTSDVVAYNNITGNKWVNNVETAYGATYTNNDIIGVAVDVDAGTVTFYKNNVSQGAITFASGGKFPYVGDGNANTFFTYAINFGQRPFAYTPPTGFLPLSTKNLPAPAIANPADHFDVVLDTGANIKATAEGRTPTSWCGLRTGPTPTTTN